MGENGTNKLDGLQDLDSLWKPSDPLASEATYQALIPAALNLTGKDRAYLTELHIQIARAQIVQSKFAEARTSLDEAQKLLEEQEAGFRVSMKIKWLIERGRLFVFEKTPSQARLSLSEAWTLAENSGEDHSVVEIAQMMAVIEPQKTQQEWLMKAIKIAEGSPQEKAKRLLGNLYTSLGWKLYDLRQYEKALETFQRSLSHLKNYGTPREIFISKWSAGKVLRAMNKTEEALAVQEALLSELGISGTHDGRLYEELAECLQTLKRTTEAQPYFELAYRELSHNEWITDNQPVKLKRMKDLGKVRGTAQ